MRKIVAPLALLASISLLTSCTKTQETPVVTPTPTQSPSPIMEDVTPPAPPAPPAPSEPPMPPMPPAPPVPPTPTSTETGSAVTPVASPAAPISRTETVKYNTPAGGDTIEFSVTVTDGVITSASATPKAENDISKKMQQGFVPKLSESVVGKKAKDLDVSAIGGASLATKAFVLFVQSF